MGTGESAPRQFYDKDFENLAAMEDVLRDIDPDLRRSVLEQVLNERGARAWQGDVL